MGETEKTAAGRVVCFATIAMCLFVSSRWSLRGQGQVDYLTEVEPIFKERCGCHQGAAESGVELSSYAELMSSIGLQYQASPITPFEPGQSPLFDVISNNPPRYGRRMPPFGTPLAAARVDLLRAWIAQGAKGGSAPSALLRGDVNESRQVDISDAVSLLVYLFNQGKEPVCHPVADCNSDGDVDITDAVTLLVYLFQGGVHLEPLTLEELEECVAGA